MKTIFLSMFEGVEAKNLLRTDVVPTLLQDPHVRVVLLMRSAERIDFYKKEFTHERLFFEAVTYKRTLGRGADRIFGYLKFLLLRTATTKLRRKISYLESRNLLSYLTLGFLNFTLARAPIRRTTRFLDYLLVAPLKGLEVTFVKWKPDLVVLAHLFEEQEVHVLRAARHRGITTIGIVNSWDKVTARAIMRLLPEKAIVFNDVVKKDMIRYNDMPASRMKVSGMPQYDVYTKKPTQTRQEFFAKFGIPEENRLIVFAPFGRSYNNTMWEAIDMLERLRAEGRFGEKVSMLVRFQPNDFLEPEELKKRPWLTLDYPGIRFSSARGVDWDMDQSQIDHLHNTLAHMDLLVCYASSITVDAFVFDKPVVNINFELKQGEPPSKLPTYHYLFEHYALVLRYGAIWLVKSEEELAEAGRTYLRNPSLHREHRKTALLEQAKFLDGRSGERMGQFILEELR